MWGIIKARKALRGAEALPQFPNSVAMAQRRNQPRDRETPARSMNPPSSSGSIPSILSPGTRFGSYEILERLGVGGMGEVYRAKDTRLDRIVAIKTISLDRHSHPEALTRFERE